MRPQDTQKFQAVMATLSVTFGKELSPQITDIYWDALKPLAIEQFEQGAKSWIRHGKHFPKPADIHDRFREMTQAAPQALPELPAPFPKWLRLVNGMFLQYLTERRIADEFRGDIDIARRRKECLSLAQWLEVLEAESDPAASEEQLKVLFDKAMARIPDRSDSPDWLDAQVEACKLQDRATA